MRRREGGGDRGREEEKKHTTYTESDIDGCCFAQHRPTADRVEEEEIRNGRLHAWPEDRVINDGAYGNRGEGGAGRGGGSPVIGFRKRYFTAHFARPRRRRRRLWYLDRASS